jgi:hypothetical protein
MIYDESKYDRVYKDRKVHELYKMGRGFQTFHDPVECELGHHPIPNGAIVYRNRSGSKMICRSCMDDAEYVLQAKTVEVQG